MKRGIYLLMVILCFGNPLRADIVVESYNVGGAFLTGVGGLNPGDQLSFFNSFDSSPGLLGIVEARNPRTVLPGGGDVHFTGNTVPFLARVDFDMGLQLGDSTIPNSELIDSEIILSDIDSDADATNFEFQFTAQFLDGTSVTSLSDLTITQSNGTFNFTNLDAGLYGAELTGTTGPTSISFKSNTGSLLRSVQFRGITPDFESDVLVISGSRTLNVTSVPEPTATFFVASMFCLAALRRRRIHPV